MHQFGSKTVGKDPSLLVTETFSSIQGEGVWAGWPCFFIRLTGCNLRCTYCDTRYAYEGGREYTIYELVSLWRDSGLKLVQITGGEPLLQQGTIPLMESLVLHKAKVLLETNGSLSLHNVPSPVIKVVDMKTPGSGMEESWIPENFRWIGLQDQIKFVITSEEDYYWARTQILHYGLFYFTQVLLSPAWGLMDPGKLASLLVRDRLSARLQLQLHKVIWRNKKGV